MTDEDFIEELVIANQSLSEIIRDLDEIINKAKKHIQLIQTYTDDERVLAQCNLILKEIEDE
ncbi:MAG: hypothetical protein VZR33_02435 [Methanosphaera sp.]|nr:hypothetical protein [Methanosphaera sp.]